MLLIIDNYDSFTYNLVQYFGELGVETRVMRNDVISVDQITLNIRPDKILISPGPGRPNDAGISLEMISNFAGKIPILGVCLGHQAIAQHFGGRIVKAKIPVHGKSTGIRHDGRGVFRDLEADFHVGRYHSLVVSRDDFPECLEVTAETSDGLIMGLRHREYAIDGVQFHPESILTPSGMGVLRNFANA